MTVEILDIIVLALSGFGFIKGYGKGLIIEISGFIALIAGCFCSFQFSSMLGAYLSSYLDWNAQSIQITSFILLFVGVVYGVSITAKILTKILKLAALGLLNRLAGGVFGALKFLVILSALIFAYQNVQSLFPIIPKNFFHDAISYPYIIEFARFLFDWIMENSENFPKVMTA